MLASIMIVSHAKIEKKHAKNEAGASIKFLWVFGGFRVWYR